MVIGRVICTICLTCACVGWAFGQEAAPARSSAPSPSPAIALTVAKGTPLQVTLDREVRVRRVGQPVHGRIVQPIYAFDHLVVPVGAEVTGRITKIESVSGKHRTLAVLNADFTPARKIEVEFDDLVLADGKHMPLHTAVTPGPGQVIQFVAAGENGKKKTLKDAADRKSTRLNSSHIQKSRMPSSA